MKKYFFIILLVNFTIAQNKPVEYTYTTNTAETYNELINDGQFNDNGKLIKSFTIVYDGSIDTFANRLILDIGNEDIISNHKAEKTIFFRKFKKPEWGNGKYTIFFQSQSFINRNMINFTCVDNKGNDCLNDIILKEKIKLYLEKILDFIPKK